MTLGEFIETFTPSVNMFMLDIHNANNNKVLKTVEVYSKWDVPYTGCKVVKWSMASGYHIWLNVWIEVEEDG